MKHISAWFDRHPKMRITLQLLLDALPMLLMLVMAAAAAKESLKPPMSDVSPILMGVYVLGAVPLFILAIILRGSADALFKRYTWCRRLSLILRFTGAFAVSFAIFSAVIALALGSL